ncbi:MAG: hypothetical protein C5B51_08785 [Terriglobia bacterium]|nr:MAG: hypothetical protein C5B51_08785 [Terriglobia bacterium]
MSRSLKFAAVASLVTGVLGAQGGRGGPAAASAQAAAPVDLTGYWVSVVTEDWRYRMVTPVKGDYPSIPLNAEGRKVADSWDPAKDEAAGNQCKSYGAGNVMRVPERLRITWENENTLKVDTDAGQQTRLFHFARTQPSPGEPTWQGDSAAQWEFAGGGRGGRRGQGQPSGGNLKIVTTHMKAGYLQKNGVPYSGNAVVTEYLHRTAEENGDSWLIVTTVVEDPQYLNARFVRSTHFKKLPDSSGWNPTPCTAR